MQWIRLKVEDTKTHPNINETVLLAGPILGIFRKNANQEKWFELGKIQIDINEVFWWCRIPNPTIEMLSEFTFKDSKFNEKGKWKWPKGVMNEVASI